MNRIFLTAGIIMLLSCNHHIPVAEQNNIYKDSINYIHQAVAFINEIERKTLQKQNFILVNKPFNFEYFNCLTVILQDTVTYSKDELAMIRQRSYPTVSEWSAEHFPDIKFVRDDTVKAIFSRRMDGWRYFYKQYGTSFNNYSMPVFLRNYTYCLFYQGNSCGDLCGEGSLRLFKKIDGKWVEIRAYCQWIS